MIDLEKAEFDLEAEAVALGEKRYRDRFEKLKKDRDLGKPETDLLMASIQPLAQAILEWTLKAQEGRQDLGGESCREARQYFNLFKPEELAHITLKNCLYACYRRVPLQALCISITNSLIRQRDYQRMLEEAPGYMRKVEDGIKSRHKGHRHKVFTHIRKKKFDIPDTDWAERDRMLITAPATASAKRSSS